MAVNTQTNIQLKLLLNTTAVECQVIDASYTLPGVGASTITETACPSGIVSEPGATTAGSLTGNVFTDSADTGVTKILLDAQRTNAQLDYVLTFFPDLGPTKGLQFTGKARVNSLKLDFSKPGINRHALDLEVSTAVFARPSVTQESQEAEEAEEAA